MKLISHKMESRLFCLIFMVVVIFFVNVNCTSDLSEYKTEVKSCQTNFSATTSIEHFYLECYIDLIFMSGGTAQCLSFNRNSLIVESSPSVLNISFKCVSNRPIYSNIQFEYGVPVQPGLKLSWQRHFTDYNDLFSYSYQVTVSPPSNAMSAIGLTSFKYNFYNIKYPDKKIQVLWHYSEVYDKENPEPDFTISWLGDITESNAMYFHTRLHANQEMVTIPCVSPHWKKLILLCEDFWSPELCPSSGIPIDNATLYHDPLIGFLLNTTKFDNRGNFYCLFFDAENSYRGKIKQYFEIEDYAKFTSSSQIANPVTINELIRPPFVHTPYAPGPQLSFILERNINTRFNFECNSTINNVTIIPRNENNDPLDLNVTHIEIDKPVKTTIARCTTPPNLEGQWAFHCTDRQSNKRLYTWQIFLGDRLALPYLELTYDNIHQCVKCFTDYADTTFHLEIRHVECENIFMCHALARCLYDTNYGIPEKNCKKGFGVGTVCETSTKHNGSTEISSSVAPPCVSVKPFSKGLVFCTAHPYDRTFQDIYFRGFDDKLYMGDVNPPLEAILKITSEITETHPLWTVPSTYLIECEAHSFYFEDGLQWFFIYSDGSSGIIPNENVNHFVSNDHTEDDFNPRSSIKVYLNSTSIVGIKCSAPVLSIRDETSHTEWQNITLKIQCKDAIAPVFLTNHSSVKEIRIGDENQGPKCQVEGFPQPKIEWFRNGQLLTNTKEDVTKRSSGEYFVENFLLFPNYRESDAGEYTCVATNIMESSERVFTVLTNNNEIDGKTLLIAVPIAAVVIVITISMLLFIAYRKKIQKLRREEMKQILEILKGHKIKSVLDSNSPNSEPINPLSIPYDKKYELEKHSFCIDKSKVLGFGEFGTVYQGRLSNVENDVAFKTIITDNDLVQLKSLTSELKILMYIGKHENIIQLLGAYTQEIEKGSLYVAIELCGLGSLHSYLKSNKGRFLSCPILNPSVKSQKTIPRGYVSVSDVSYSSNHSIKTLLKWSAEIANAMDFLGTKNVVHSDLATRNVLLTVEFVAKITDFGLSRKIYSAGEYVKKGRDDPLPWRWLAIESLKNLTFSPESDVWSYGITVWEIFSFGDVPYPGIENPGSLKSQLENGMRPNPKPKLASCHLYEVMLKCWDLVPERRPSFKALKLLFENAVGRDTCDVDPRDLAILADTSNEEIIYIYVAEDESGDGEEDK